MVLVNKPNRKFKNIERLAFSQKWRPDEIIWEQNSAVPQIWIVKSVNS